MVRTRYKPNPIYKLLSVLLCSALLLNSIALPPVLYAQSTANDQDGKPAVYLPLIQSSPTASLSDKATETATVSAANTTLPTPSGAKPPYPLNHQLDGLFAVAGTPPSNYNFETAGYYVGTPPTNADLSAAVTEVGTPPTNQDFATGDLTGWTTSGTVTIQSDATYSNYARLQSSAVLVSDAFTVDSAAQQIAFAIGYFSSAAINLYVLSGAGYSTRTKIDYLYCNTCGWTTYTLDAAAYSGQSIKLEFNRAGGTLGIDNLQMRILLPGYTVQNPIERVEQSNGNVYARLGYNGLLTSAAFTVETSAQVATVDVSGLTTASDQYRIDVLSGPTYATVTQATVNTSTPDSWQRVQLNLATWQGQSVKLRIKGLYGAVGFDNIGVQSIFLPDWQFSGTATVGDDGDGNHYVATAGNLVSAPFTLDANLQQITLRHRSGGTGINRFELKLLRGANFSNEVDLTGGQVSSNPGAWQTFKLALNLYAGETVKLKVVANGPMHFDDIGPGENLLPGWQVRNHNAIAIGEDNYGSYVTGVGSAFIIRSDELTPGVPDRSSSVETRHYAIAYDIGQVTGSLLRVDWVDAQGNSTQLMQDAANTPTGYRERHFLIYDTLPQTGRLAINVLGGKLYSVADNIARQHLAEPYALDVGVDTSTGGLSVARSDLTISGTLPLTFTRYYNSQVDQLGNLGYGWSHSYTDRLTITEDGDGEVILANRQERFFDWSSTSQTFTAVDPRNTATLAKQGDGTYLFTAGSDQYHFATTGRLLSISSGAQQASMGYDGSGHLTTVTVASSNVLTLTYDSNGRLGGVNASNGESVTYTYTSAGDLASAERSGSDTESYGYDRHRLTQIVSGETLLMQNNYDDFHRIAQQGDVSGQITEFSYGTPGAGATAVYDNDGVTYFYFDRFQRTTYVLYADGSSTTYVYDANGNLIDTIYEGVNHPPTVTVAASPNSGATPLQVTFTATASDSDNDPLTYAWGFGDGATGGNSAVITHTYTSVGYYTATVMVSDTVTLAATQIPITVTLDLPELQPDAIDPTAPTTLLSAVDFLYTGSDPVQTGVLSGTITAQRIAVARGRVLGPNGQPAPGVQVTVLGHPEFGQTQSRADGNFDLAVNGGGQLTFNFTHSAYLPVQRQSAVGWQEYIHIDDVVMTALDPVVTDIDLTATLPIQVARGSAVSDDNGTRQSTLLIPQGVQATMVLPDGSTQALTTLHIRSTEYTVGDRGPAAMPGALPPQSGYTYAVELSVDEALAVGATDVRFTQPLYHYVENFRDFPVGMAVPNGYYDRARATWVPAKDGRVIRIVTIANGLAELDTNGDNVADNNAALGITDAERQQLATLYTSAQSLWRVPIEHFTPWDHNWPFRPPDGAPPPDKAPPGSDKKPDNPCEASGSIIECETQVVGQRLALVGVPYTLNYRSDRTLGRSAYLNIPVIGATVPDDLLRAELQVSVAGQQFQTAFARLPNQSYTFVWDRKDGFGRPVQGAQMATVSVGYVYEGQYDTPTDSGNGVGISFGNAGGEGITGDLGSVEVALWRSYDVLLGGWDARGQGLGGWSLDVHHVYDPGQRLLYLGDGQRRSVDRTDRVIQRVAGTGNYGYNGDGAALSRQLANPWAMAFGPDGSLYFAETARIRRLSPDGQITTIAGTGVDGYNGDGIPATQAQIDQPKGLALAPDGTLYLSDTGNQRIRRIDASGIITTIAGMGMSGYSGNGGPATQARLNYPEGITFGPDGSLYIADTMNNRVRRVTPNGLITTVAGTGGGGSNGDGGPAQAAKLWGPRDVAVGPDGSLYIADWVNDKVRQVSASGIITTVAGNGGFTFQGDGKLATRTSVAEPFGVEVGPDGSLYILHGGWHIGDGAQEPLRVRQVLPTGMIVTIAGGHHDLNSYVNNAPATTATLREAEALALAPDGSLYVSDRGYDDIRRISAALPGFTGADLAIPSADGRELYQFSWEGRHLRTLNALTGATLYTFAYTASGLLDHITDGANNSTLIERAPDGAPTAIVGPYGERTAVGLDSNGYLNLITNPAQETVQLEYTTLGLLTRMSDPRNSAYASTYLYDSEGRLVRNTNASGGYQTFTRTPTVSGYMVTKQNALGHTTQYAVADLDDGRQLRRVIAPNGAFVTTESRLDGTTITTDTRGVVTTLVMGADPRWGMQAPYVRQITSRTPSGQAFFTMTANRTVTLATPTNPLTVQSQVDTVIINGRTTTTSYNGPPRLLITNNPSGEVTTMALDPLGRPVQVNRVNFAPVLYVYDSRGRLERVQEGEGAAARTTVMAYDALGYLDKVTDALLGETTFTYDAAGRLTAQQLPSLQWLTFDYDDAGNLIKQINAQGVQTDFVYDPHNRLQAQVVDPGGRAVRSEFAYDLADNLTQAVADVGAGRLNLTTHYTYTPFSPGGDYLLQQVIDPEGHATQFTYTPAGDLRTATDALGQTTTYTYTVQGWLTQMRTPQGRVATTLYTNDGQPDWVSDPRGSVTDYVYDAQGRLKTVMAGTVALGTAPALNQTITYTYDINDRVRIVTDGRNQAHTLSYDAFGRLEWEQDPLGNRLTYSYDKLDRLEEQVIGSNNPLQAVTTRYSYDAVGRRTTMRLDPDGLNLTTVYSYTQPGSSDTWNLQQVRDPKGQVTKYSYNSLGLRAATTDALNHTWTFAYDNLGRLDYQTDPLGHVVDYVVDGLGRTAELHQDGRVEKWAFRPDGALDNYTDFAGRVTTFAYDNDQLLTGIDYPAPMADVGYGYDAAGNVTSVSDGLGSTSYSYDVLNRLDTRTRGSRVIDYGYSATNQVTSIDYWSQGTVGYGYDNAGRLDTLTPWGGAATTYSYRSSGLLAGISRPNSVATTYSYDTASRLTGLHHVQGGSNSLNNIVYGLDANGNRDWMTDLDGLTDYVYDALNRLDAVTYPAIPGGPPAATIDYSMDEVGNRTGDGTTTYGHDASDRITNSGFVYDTNGNLLSDGVKSYEYDAANHLTKVISGSVTIDYGYDGWGNLILESRNGITTEYVLDERGALPTILGEVRSDGTERLYAYGPEGFAAQKVVGGAVEYPLLDGLGSVRHLTDNNGSIVLYRSYDAFGIIRASGGTSSSRLGYTGELQDSTTGLVYLRARHYHPVLGRFLQRDSFAGFQQRPQSFNRYSYTENNPINHVDPSGKFLPLYTGVIGAGAAFIGSVGGQLLTSEGNLSDRWNSINWIDVSVATGVGFVAGFVAPWTALTPLGSILTNAAASGIQYLLSQGLNGRDIDYVDIAANLIIGGIAGYIAGPISRSRLEETYDLMSPWLQRHLPNLRRAIDAEKSQSVVAWQNLLRSGLAGLWSNYPPLSGYLRNYFDRWNPFKRFCEPFDKLSNRYLERLDDFGNSWWGFFFNSN